MPDISMCSNEHCKLKETCYRYKAIPNEYRQSYGDFKSDSNNECEYYWEIDPIKELEDKRIKHEKT